MKKIVIFLIIVFMFTPSFSNAIPLGGNNVVDRSSVDTANGVLFFDLNNPISQDGVIDSWRIFTSGSKSGIGQLKLKIFRDIGDTWKFIGESPVEEVSVWGAVNTFVLPAPISVQSGDIISWWYPDNTVASIVFDGGGSNLNNHDWPNEPIGDIQQDIPDLVDRSLSSSEWNGTLWDINPRTYSIEVLGSAAIPEPATIVLSAIGIAGLAGAVVRRKIKKAKKKV